MKSTYKAIEVRGFWLFTGLFGSILISFLIKSYEAILERYILLAAFVPLIVYIGDAVGSQMESIVIREVARDKEPHIKKFFLTQTPIVLGLAAIFGILSYVAVLTIYNTPEVALVVSLAVTVSIISSLITGSLIPLMFWKFHQDPAEASAPVAAIIQDTLSIIIYFSIAQYLLNI